MRQIGWLMIIGLCFASALNTQAGIFPYDLNKTKLDNGLQVVSVPFDSPGIVSFFMLVRVGSREEIEPGVTGFAHFFEHCMFRGTENYSKDQYGRILQEMAAAGNANTWLDRTLYYFTGNADDLERMFEIESDRFRHLKYSEHDFKAEAGAVLGEYTKNFASPFRQMNEKLADLAFDKHTYKHTTMGFIADIKDMPNQYDYSLKFYDRFYRPEYCTLLVVGDAGHETVVGLAKKYLGDWERGGYVAKIPQEPEQKAPRKAHVRFAGNTNMISLAYKGPAYSDAGNDKVALNLLFELGFSQKSAIYKKLVQKERKARFIQSLGFDTRDPFLVGVTAQSYQAEDMGDVLAEVEAVLNNFKTVPVASEELEAIKSRQKYALLGRLNTPFQVGNILSRFIWLSGDPESVNRNFELMENVNPEDIMRVAKIYFEASKKILVTLSSEENGL